jgi:hypothetical protein
MGDTHVGKRKVHFMLLKTSKKGNKAVVIDDETYSCDKSPQYQRGCR